jgi:hypothetical protein
MSNLINEELETMKYLFGYQKGKVISEQEKPAAAPATSPTALTAPDIIMKIQRILVDKYKTNLGNSGPKGDGVDGQWGSLTQTAFENATKSSVTTPANSTAVNVKIDPQVTKSKGFMVVKDNGQILMADQVKNGLIGSVDARDYDYVLLSTDGSTYACQSSTASCYSSNKKTGNVVNKTNNIQSAKTNVGL